MVLNPDQDERDRQQYEWREALRKVQVLTEENMLLEGALRSIIAEPIAAMMASSMRAKAEAAIRLLERSRS